MSEAPTVHQAMSGVMGAIGVVGKDRRNEHFKYNFRGIDDVLNAVHNALVAYGVFYVPEVLEAEYGIAGKQRVATLKVRYRFYGPAGDHVEAVTVAEGMDSGDKAPNKALSAALKYALIQVFAIPTEDTADPDRDAPDTSGQPGTSQQPPAEQTPERNAQQEAVKIAFFDLDDGEQEKVKSAWVENEIPRDFTKLTDDQCRKILDWIDAAGKPAGAEEVPF